jgi:hypothetical protein
MALGRRNKESEAVQRQFRRWRKSLLLWLDDLQRKTPSSITQLLVIITLFSWLLLYIFGIVVIRIPMTVIWPLYGLYPGVLAPDKPNFNLRFLHEWGIGAGVVFLALAVIGMWRKNRLAAVILLVLFLVSTLIAFARVLEHSTQQ